MKRKTSKNPSRIYSYGCSAPLAGALEFADQLHRAHRYYNARVALERERRAKYRAIRSVWSAELGVLETREHKICTALKDAEGEVEAALLAELGTVWAEAKPYRQQFAALLEPAREEFSKRKADLVKELGNAPRTVQRINAEIARAMLAEPEWPEEWRAVTRLDAEYSISGDAGPRAESGLEFGTYLLTDEAFAASIKLPKKDATEAERRRKRGDPDFARWDGSGRVGVQLRDANVIPETGPVALTGSYLQIDPPLLPRVGTGRNAQPAPKRARQTRARVRLRVGSRDKRGMDPIWAEFEVVFHRRPIGIVKRAWILVTRRGPDTRYSLQLSLESPTFGVLPSGRGVAAVNIGWRAMPDGGHRVAYLVDGDGYEEELRLDPEIPRALDYADELKQHQAEHFNAARVALMALVQVSPEIAGLTIEQPRRYPETGAELVTLAQASRYAPQWRSPRKFAMLAARIGESVFAAGELRTVWQRWRTERLGSGLDLFDGVDVISAWAAAHGAKTVGPQLAIYLEIWRRKNRHLYQLEVNTRAKATERRRDDYRKWVAWTARTYTEVLIGDQSVRETPGACEEVAGESRQTTAARVNRVAAAPGELKRYLVEVLGAKAFKDALAGMSRRCTACGASATTAADLARAVQVKCRACGHAEDQDARNCRNRLRERLGDAEKV